MGEGGSKPPHPTRVDYSDIGSPMVTRYVQRNNLKSLGEME
ncbi:hypothetical protein pVa3_0058 [Vibrio phage pVa-3]|nr:hypothetical protein pVa3_0058 [Vibrio phage pVa-3]